MTKWGRTKTGEDFGNTSYRGFQFYQNSSKTTVLFHRNGVCLRTASDGLKLILKMINCGHGEGSTTNYETASTNPGFVILNSFHKHNLKFLIPKGWEYWLPEAIIFLWVWIRILLQNDFQPIVSMVKDEPQTMKTASTNLVKLKVVEI